MPSVFCEYTPFVGRTFLGESLPNFLEEQLFLTGLLGGMCLFAMGFVTTAWFNLVVWTITGASSIFTSGGDNEAVIADIKCLWKSSEN